MKDIKKETPSIRNSQKKQVEKKIDDEFLEDLPPEARKVLQIGMMSMHKVGSIPNPIADKITEKHIDKILEIAEKDDERAFQDTKEARRYTLIYFLIFTGLFVFCTVFLVKRDKELYKEAIKLFAIFAGGFGGGFGLKTYIDRNRQ